MIDRTEHSFHAIFHQEIFFHFYFYDENLPHVNEKVSCHQQSLERYQLNKVFMSSSMCLGEMI